MSAGLNISDDATRTQIAAADPRASTWLSANAGSGKTRVLTDRVARLLLAGVPPQRILCLTYTKAAASEMQNRLFQRLGAWAMMPDTELAQSLAALGVDAAGLNPTMLCDARRLFALAIETPGGLKIQTIHSFCAQLLRRFPLEAGVSPAFTEMDERSGRLLRADLVDEIAQAAPRVMADFARHFAGDDLDGLLAEIARKRDLYENLPSERDLRTQFDLGPDVSHESLARDVFSGGETGLLRACAARLAQSPKATDIKLAAALAPLDLTAPDILPSLEKLFLTASGKTPGQPKTHPPTKDGKDALGDQLDAFNALRARVADAKPQRLALAAFEKTRCLHQFATAYLWRLDQRKQQRAWLDFDDLILRTRMLLTDPGVAAWVLFRLDGGLDHILVDEAQDTSPAQWDVIRLLAQEFTAGQGARPDTERTIFVVGDQKQSIYSFQGAEPQAFDKMRTHFTDALEAVGQKLHRRELLYSFRSSKPVLDLVDASFTEDLRRDMGDQIRHLPFKTNLPGRVDMWPWIEDTETPEPKAWFDPVDTVGKDHPAVGLARRIAAFVADRLRHGQITQVLREDGVDKVVTRRIEAGDFLILVQRRSDLFHEIIRACKDAELPIAGADRLKVGGEIGVKDLTALLAYLATPEDDLSLACVLRSPLCGLSEADLFDLAHGRDGTYLTRRLEQHKDRFPGASALLRDLRDQADYLRPYELLERILTRHGGRQALLARLGQEAEEGIAALLDQALEYERSGIPSLTGFLGWLGSDEITIKRQMDSNNNQIRVMTVHGAKGLEAPIVILPDTGTRQNRVRGEVFDINGTPVWKARADQMPDAQADASNALKESESAERMRLLYVAMTRAESWLIICGAGDPPNPKGDHWYTVISAGLEALRANPGPDGLRLEHLDWPADTVLTTGSDNSAKARPVPDWTQRNATAVQDPPKPLLPSELGGAKFLAGTGADARDMLDEAAAKARGTEIHLLLEHLPPDRPDIWEDAARGLLAPDAATDALDAARRVLTAPDLAFLFAPETLAEVGFAARILGRDMRGTIDRLVIQPDRILAVDFKSNTVVPGTPAATPEGLLRQMGAYAEALAQIYPGKNIVTAIVWTENAQLMELPHDIVSAALSRAHTS